MTLALICAGLLAASPATDPPDLTRTYQEARARTGKSSEEQVRLALWCEAHGLTKERLNHLALAVLSDPANATARGLMGRFRHGILSSFASEWPSVWCPRPAHEGALRGGPGLAVLQFG